MRSEDKLHRHHPDDKAHLFTSRGQGQTENEYLELLEAVVRCCKPEAAVETGTYLGDGSLAILSAMRTNGFGHLDTVEASRAHWEKGNRRLTREFLQNTVTWEHHLMPAQRFLVQAVGPYGFAFLDCDLATRHIELDMLMSRGLLSPGAFVMVHDTSPLRLQRPEKVKIYREGMAEVLPKWGVAELVEFPLSRGMTLLRAPHGKVGELER